MWEDAALALTAATLTMGAGFGLPGNMLSPSPPATRAHSGRKNQGFPNGRHVSHHLSVSHPSTAARVPKSLQISGNEGESDISFLPYSTLLCSLQCHVDSTWHHATSQWTSIHPPLPLSPNTTLFFPKKNPCFDCRSTDSGHPASTEQKPGLQHTTKERKCHAAVVEAAALQAIGAQPRVAVRSQ